MPKDTLKNSIEIKISWCLLMPILLFNLINANPENINFYVHLILIFINALNFLTDRNQSLNVFTINETRFHHFINVFNKTLESSFFLIVLINL